MSLSVAAGMNSVSTRGWVTEPSECCESIRRFLPRLGGVGFMELEAEEGLELKGKIKI